MICGTVSQGTANCPQRHCLTFPRNLGPGIPIDRSGIAALNKSGLGSPTEAIGSNPDHPTYAAYVEVFHQLHCLVRVMCFSYPLGVLTLIKLFRTRYDKQPGRLTVLTNPGACYILGP